jgi:hypothetical protein
LGWWVAAASVFLLTSTTVWGSPDALAKVVHESTKGVTPGLVHAPIQNATLNTTMTTSTNWAGYANTGKAGVTPPVTFSSVVGSWVQPAVTCPANAQQDSSFWVGIDGFLKGSSTVEQIGTDSDCDKKNKKLKTGGPTYYAWWEMYPAPSNTITTSKPPQYRVFPGDGMTAEVSIAVSSFTLTLTDATQGWSFSTVQTPSPTPPELSAEWIVEAPSKCDGCAPLKLADFGSATFTGITDTPSSSPSNVTAWPIDMKKGKKVKASTMALSQSSFVVTWESN